MLKKLINLSDNVAVRLDQEPNASVIVDALLHSYYGLAIEGEGAHIDKRQEVLDQLGNDLVASEAVASPSTELATEPTPTFQEAVIETKAELASDTDTLINDPMPMVEPLVLTPDQQLMGVTLPEPVATVSEPSLATTFTPDAAPVGALEAVIDPNTLEPVGVPAPVEPVVTDIPVNLNGEPASVCPNGHAYIGPICIDCMD